MEPDTLKNKLINKELDDILLALYPVNQISEQHSRYCSAIESFENHFTDLNIEIYSAPGRTEICGNHTDHQHGQVLAAAIDLDAIAIVSAVSNGIINILSDGYEMITIDTSDVTFNESQYGTTIALIKGILCSFKEHGYLIGGFNAYITSNVIIGAGLSSSAAFEALIGTVLSGLYNNSNIPSIEIAKIGQFAENIYFGKPCGLMDQMACSVGGIVHIDFSNLKEPAVCQISFDLENNGYALCIVDTKGSHSDLTDDYAQIPLEMEAAARFFNKNYLNEVDPQEFFRSIPDMMNTISHRCILRGIHFFEENKRVQFEVNALKSNNFDMFLKNINESGSSSFRFLQNIYTNHDISNQPVSIALAASEHILKDRGVSRVHGGGFAGTIQTFVEKAALKEYTEYMDYIFGQGACHVLTIRNKGGIKVFG